MDKELINAKLISIESWAYRARHQVECGKIDNLLSAVERIQQAVDEINQLMKMRRENGSTA